LLTELGIDGGADVEKAKGVNGGLNDGIWFVRNGSEELVLKLVKFDPRRPEQLVEAECLKRLYREHPEIVYDAKVAFPHHVLRLLGDGNVRRYDLIVMDMAPGKVFSNVISEMWYGHRKSELMDALQEVGACLGEFHARYQKKHGDLNTANVFYDETSRRATLIDIGGMGQRVGDTDLEHFSQSLQNLANHYGEELFSEGIQHFQSGYGRTSLGSRAAQGRSRSVALGGA